MFLFLTAFLVMTSALNDPVSVAIEKYKTVESYSVTLRSTSSESAEVIKYYYRKPGFVRMEFIKPHKGAVLVYSPLKKEVRLRPFGFFETFIITLSPDNRLVKSSKGHRVDESDIGALLQMVSRLQSKGKTRVLSEEVIAGRKTILVSVEGEKDFSVEGIHRYLIWLDKNIYLPLKVAAYNSQGSLIEEVLMDDLETSVEIPERSFDF